MDLEEPEGDSGDMEADDDPWAALAQPGEMIKEAEVTGPDRPRKTSIPGEDTS